MHKCFDNPHILQECNDMSLLHARWFELQQQRTGRTVPVHVCMRGTPRALGSGREQWLTSFRGSDASPARHVKSCPGTTLYKSLFKQAFGRCPLISLWKSWSITAEMHTWLVGFGQKAKEMTGLSGLIQCIWALCLRKHDLNQCLHSQISLITVQYYCLYYHLQRFSFRFAKLYSLCRASMQYNADESQDKEKRKKAGLERIKCWL